MSDPFLSEIRIFPYNFAPRGWAFCDGQILPIAQYTALFSLLGTTYGGNGQNTFALPDLRGRVAVDAGQGPGLSNYSLGQISGSETVTLIANQMPAHNHAVNARSNAAGGSNDPAGRVPALGAWAVGVQSGVVQSYTATPAPLVQKAPGALQPSGGNQPHNNVQPYLTLAFCIALEGIYPSRN